MDPLCLIATVQAAGGGVMVWGMFSWHTLVPLSTNWESFKYTTVLKANGGQTQY